MNLCLNDKTNVNSDVLIAFIGYKYIRKFIVGDDDSNNKMTFPRQIPMKHAELSFEK